MQTVILEISDDIKEVVLSFLKILPNDAVKVLEYEDSIFTTEDELTYKTAINEKNSGESVSLASLKEKYSV
jgi:hypothetical protein